MGISSGIELRHLRAFVAVAEELSFRAAAERLHLSQPPLSRTIAQFESLLGRTLFVRSRQGVALSASGSVLLPRARAGCSSPSRRRWPICPRPASGRRAAGRAWACSSPCTRRRRPTCAPRPAHPASRSGARTS